MTRRPRRLIAGAALKEHQEGPVATLRVGHLASKDRYGLRFGPVVVERDLEFVFGKHQARGRYGFHARKFCHSGDRLCL
jgi:hypothetical protein